MRLKAGDQAIDFNIKDIQGNSWHLEDFKGKKLMLSFYRYAACPLCNLRVHSLSRKYALYKEHGIEMLAVFQSPKENIIKYTGKRNAPFPMIPDPERKLYKQYGVESSMIGLAKGFFTGTFLLPKLLKSGIRPGKIDGDTSLIPADFLIGPDLKIEKAFYGKDIGDHIPEKEIEEWLGIKI